MSGETYWVLLRMEGKLIRSSTLLRKVSFRNIFWNFYFMLIGSSLYNLFLLHQWPWNTTEYILYVFLRSRSWRKSATSFKGFLFSAAIVPLNIYILNMKTEVYLVIIKATILTLLRMGLFGAAHRGECQKSSPS